MTAWFVFRMYIVNVQKSLGVEAVRRVFLSKPPWVLPTAKRSERRLQCNSQVERVDFNDTTKQVCK